MGHEIAAHGVRHRSYNSMTREEIEKDLLSCKDAFDQIELLGFTIHNVFELVLKEEGVDGILAEDLIKYTNKKIIFKHINNF